jgi:hypothetical protein
LIPAGEVSRSRLRLGASGQSWHHTSFDTRYAWALSEKNIPQIERTKSPDGGFR